MSEPFTLTREQVRELDRRASEEFGVPGLVLMENAGRGCAELLMRLNPGRQPVLILCGPGNNGGDGFVLARHLDNHGWPVIVYAVECPGPTAAAAVRCGWDFSGLPPDARTNWEIITRGGLSVVPLSRSGLTPAAHNALTDALRQPGRWVVDALFGTGLTRPLAGLFAELVALINSCGNPVLAVDLPSGLDCDTGEPLGPTVRAAHTATFVARKRGFLNPAAAAWTGDVTVVDIGAPRKLVEQYARPMCAS